MINQTILGAVIQRIWLWAILLGSFFASPPRASKDATDSLIENGLRFDRIDGWSALIYRDMTLRNDGAAPAVFLLRVTCGTDSLGEFGTYFPYWFPYAIEVGPVPPHSSQRLLVPVAWQHDAERSRALHLTSEQFERHLTELVSISIVGSRDSRGPSEPFQSRATYGTLSRWEEIEALSKNIWAGISMEEDRTSHTFCRLSIPAESLAGPNSRTPILVTVRVASQADTRTLAVLLPQLEHLESPAGTVSFVLPLDGMEVTPEELKGARVRVTRDMESLYLGSRMLADAELLDDFFGGSAKEQDHRVTTERRASPSPESKGVSP